MLGHKSVTSGDAVSLRGKLLHLAATRPGRTGRLPMPYLSDIADGKAAGWSKGLEVDLSFARLQLDSKHVRHYPLLPSIEIGPRVWSDASFAVKSGRIE